ncbi:hypothetical protein PMAYCL1PPCAC_20783, partial [Pristionchus mayeri]
RPDVSFVATVAMNHIRIVTCEISNFIIISKGDGTIRRLTDPVVTPQCVLCEEYPGTVYGYATHLRRHHKTTLKANGIYLICACGLIFRNHDDHKKNDGKCTERGFTLQNGMRIDWIQKCVPAFGFLQFIAHFCVWMSTRLVLLSHSNHNL